MDKHAVAKKGYFDLQKRSQLRQQVVYFVSNYGIPAQELDAFLQRV